MREIKFRGYSNSKEEMLYGYYTVSPKGSACIETKEGVYIVEKDTVGQFTGLYEKNGKEIYEGDVLKSENGKFEVIFKNGSFGIVKEEKYSFYSDEIVEKIIPLRNIEFYNMGVDND